MGAIKSNLGDWCSMGVPNTGMRKNLTCYNGIQKSIWLDAIMAQFYARFFSNYFHNILLNFFPQFFSWFFAQFFHDLCSIFFHNFWDNVCPILFLFCLKIDSSGRTIVDFILISFTGQVLLHASVSRLPKLTLITVQTTPRNF